MIDIEKLAREAGFVAYGEDCGEYRIPTPAFKQRMEWFAALVLEKAAALASKRASDFYFESPFAVELNDLAAAIRALKQ